MDEDAERIHHPYDDAIIITLLIADYTTRRVLVDNGSSADTLYYPTFQQMRLGRDQLRPVNSPLVGFRGMKVQPVGTITLPVVVGAYPQHVTKNMNFLMVDCSSFYNAIIGRPTLNSWKAVTSTYHLPVKCRETNWQRKSATWPCWPWTTKFKRWTLKKEEL